MYKKYLNQLVNIILIHNQQVPDSGLMKGRLGLALFLYNYSLYSDNEFYSDYADSLIDNVYDSVSQYSPKYFESGISGIGWSLDYLIKNHFVEGENDVLEDIDSSMEDSTDTNFSAEMGGDIPLFSRGLYFAQRGIKEKLERALSDCYTYLQNNEIIIPALYLNSIFYTINKAEHLKVHSQLCESILDKIYSIVQISIEEYSDVDLYALKRNIEHITLQDKKRKWQKFIDHIRINVDLLEIGWIHFVFHYDSPRDMNLIRESEIIKVIENVMQGVESEILPLYDGLIGLGLELIRCSGHQHHYDDMNEYKKNGLGEKVIPSPTDILYLSTSVGSMGGAFTAGYRIHTGLRQIGLNSKMLVLNSRLSHDQNTKSEIHIASRRSNELCGYNNDMQPLAAYPKYEISSHGFSPAVVGIDIVSNIDKFSPNLVILHSVNGGFMTIEELGRIHNKLIWRLPDCWAFTGGCYYFGDCKRYMTECGKCPKLGSNSENDLSRDLWKRKEKAWSNLEMTVVVPTLWMKKLVADSTLLKNRDIHIIPNGLNIDEFYPLDKQLSRKTLNIPSDKKVIIFGAINAFDPRKGGALLFEALQLLSEKHEREYYFVVFGVAASKLSLDIPTKFLGYISDRTILQLAYSAADLMIVPSLEEAFGQTVIEAMACATPVVSFEETGPADIIDPKLNGYLARYKDSNDMAQGIEWILSDIERLNSLSDNARSKVESIYDIRLIAEQYKELYERILAQERR